MCSEALPADLAADLASGGNLRVHVGVGRAGPDRCDQLVQRAGRDLLSSAWADDVGGKDRPRHRAARARASRPASPAAEEGRDTAVDAELADVDMGEQDVTALEALIGQLEVDGTFVV